MEPPKHSRRLVVEGGESIVDFDNKAFKPIPQEGIDLAVNAMNAGVMYRYQPKSKEASITANFEHNFAKYMQVKHAVGTNSCGSAMFIALNIVGVQPGDIVLTNAFTFHAVPVLSNMPGPFLFLLRATESGQWIPKISTRKRHRLVPRSC